MLNRTTPLRLSFLLALAALALGTMLLLVAAPAQAQSNQGCPLGTLQVQSTSSTPDTINVYWADQRLAGGVVVDSYFVFWGPKDGSARYRNSPEIDPQSRSYKITKGLSPGTEYEIWLSYMANEIPYTDCGTRHYVSTKPDPSAPIQIQFDRTMYTRSEGINPYADVTVIRSPGASTENAIDFTLTAKEVPEGHGAAEGGASNATPGSDFAGGAYKGTIPAGATSATVNIPILDDNIAEVPEDFLVTLTSDDPSKAVVRDKHDEALVSLNDNDDVRLSYQTDYLKLGEPGWKHRTGELAIHADKGTSKRISMSCRSKDGKIAPFDWDIPVSNNPQTSRVTVSPVKDGDFKYDYDTLTCGLRHTPVMVKTEKLKSGIPVWVEDGDALNIPKGEFYLGGDMVKPGFQANMTLFVTRPEGVNSSETFNIDYLNPHYCDKAKMTGPSSVTVPESRGTNNILFSVQVPSDSCDIYVIRAMPTTPNTYQGAAKTGGFGLVYVATVLRPGGL